MRSLTRNTHLRLFITAVMVLAVFALGSPALPVLAANINVADGLVAPADDGQCSLVEAIRAANNDDTGPNNDCTQGNGPDTIILGTGPYNILNMYGADAGLPHITTTVTINGNGQTIRRGNGTWTCPQGDGDDFRIFRVRNASLTLDDVVVRDGCDVGGPRAEGGAIYATNSYLEVRDGSQVIYNAAKNFFEGRGALGGGIAAESSEVLVRGSMVNYNVAEGSDYCEGENNEEPGCGPSPAEGGGIWARYSDVTVRNSQVNNNRALGGDGFMYGNGERASGGGIRTAATNLIVDSSDVSNNDAIAGAGYTSNPAFGGGIVARGALDGNDDDDEPVEEPNGLDYLVRIINGSTIDNNEATSKAVDWYAAGGGAFIGNETHVDLLVENSFFTNNRVHGQGARLWGEGGGLWAVDLSNYIIRGTLFDSNEVNLNSNYDECGIFRDLDDSGPVVNDNGLPCWVDGYGGGAFLGYTIYGQVFGSNTVTNNDVLTQTTDGFYAYSAGGGLFLLETGMPFLMKGTNVVSYNTAMASGGMDYNTAAGGGIRSILGIGFNGVGEEAVVSPPPFELIVENNTAHATGNPYEGNFALGGGISMWHEYWEMYGGRISQNRAIADGNTIGGNEALGGGVFQDCMTYFGAFGTTIDQNVAQTSGFANDGFNLTEGGGIGTLPSFIFCRNYLGEEPIFPFGIVTELADNYIVANTATTTGNAGLVTGGGLFSVGVAFADNVIWAFNHAETDQRFHAVYGGGVHMGSLFGERDPAEESSLDASQRGERSTYEHERGEIPQGEWSGEGFATPVATAAEEPVVILPPGVNGFLAFDNTYFRNKALAPNGFGGWGGAVSGWENYYMNVFFSLIQENRATTNGDGLWFEESSEIIINQGEQIFAEENNHIIDGAGSQYNCIIDNGIGLGYDNPGTYLATKNWWDHNTGPSGPSGIGLGDGLDILQGTLLYDPWLLNPPDRCGSDLDIPEFPDDDDDTPTDDDDDPRPQTQPGFSVFDPALSKAGNPLNVQVGETVIWTIIATNTGDTTLNDVVVTDPIPSQFDIVSVSSTQGATAFGGGIVTVNIGTMQPGDVVTITVETVGNESALPGVICNTATSGDNSTQGCVTVAPDELPDTGGQPVTVPWFWIGAAAVLAFAGGAYVIRRQAVSL